MAITAKNMRNNNTMKSETIMTTYTEGFEPHTVTDSQYIYKWLAETYLYKHKGSKDIRKIVYHEKYDGLNHITFYVSNGTRVDVTVPRM